MSRALLAFTLGLAACSGPVPPAVISGDPNPVGPGAEGCRQAACADAELRRPTLEKQFGFAALLAPVTQAEPTCTPGAYACGGVQVRRCNPEGTAFDVMYDCSTDSQNSQTNPLICSMAGTDGYYQTSVDAQVGCAYTQPVCVTSTMTGGLTEFGGVTRYSYNQELPSYAGTGNPTTQPASHVCVYQTQGASDAAGDYDAVSLNFEDPATPLAWSMQLPIDPALLQPGTSVDFQTLVAAHPGLTGVVTTGSACTSWSGTLTLNEGPPAWSLTLALTCLSDAALAINTTVSGTL
jgi:hypothetical protein